MFIQQEYYELQLVFEVTSKEGFSIGVNDKALGRNPTEAEAVSDRE